MAPATWSSWADALLHDRPEALRGRSHRDPQVDSGRGPWRMLSGIARRHRAIGQGRFYWKGPIGTS